MKTPNLKNNENLWMLLIKGDADSLEIIYKDFYDLLLNYGLKMYPNQEFVEDCIQDLFIKIYQSKQLNPTSSVRSYLLKSIRNMIRERLSAEKNLEQIDEQAFKIEEPCNYEEIRFAHDDKDLQLKKKLIHSYNRLSENQRMIVYLRYVRGLSHEEIANIVGINRQSSMNASSRILAKLRELLQDSTTGKKAKP